MSALKIDGKFRVERIIGWVAALITAAVCIVVFLFSTFETTSASQRQSDNMENRLDRIEKKVDAVLEGMK